MNVAEYLDGVVHEPTQADGAGFDLTLDRVLEVSAPGRIDFGGDELEPADVEAVPTEKRNPGDDYGWWTLQAGRYLIEHNESVAADGVRLTVQPRTELLECGGDHPTVTVSDLTRLPLSVCGAGLKLKENARVSTVVEIDTG